MFYEGSGTDKQSGGAGGLQVDRPHKQHLYEIYCLQIQMVEPLQGGKREGVVGTVQVNCFWILGSVFTV